MKRIVFALIGLFLLLLSVPSFAFGEGFSRSDQTLKMPESLVILEESAFEGTAATMVYLPDGVSVIESRAFADMPNLKVAFIPKSVREIGKDLFGSVKDVTLIGVAGSPTQDWAKRNGYRFIPWDVWSAVLPERMDVRHTLLPDMFHEWDADDARRLRRLSWSLPEQDNSDPEDNPSMYQVDYDFP